MGGGNCYGGNGTQQLRSTGSSGVRSGYSSPFHNNASSGYSGFNSLGSLGLDHDPDLDKLNFTDWVRAQVMILHTVSHSNTQCVCWQDLLERRVNQRRYRCPFVLTVMGEKNEGVDVIMKFLLTSQGVNRIVELCLMGIPWRRNMHFLHTRRINSGEIHCSEEFGHFIADIISSSRWGWEREKKPLWILIANRALLLMIYERTGLICNLKP